MISPYALLNASRPKPTPSVVTPYDLYSAVQNNVEPPAPVSVSEPPVSPPLPRLQGRKTHYIRDISLRHNNAARQTTFSAPPSP